jgi:hypothetical protein
MKLLNIPSENDCLPFCVKRISKICNRSASCTLERQSWTCFLVLHGSIAQALLPQEKKTFRPAGEEQCDDSCRDLCHMYFKLSSALVVKFGQDMASSSMRQTKQAELILNLQSCFAWIYRTRFTSIEKHQDAILTQAGRGRKCDASRDLSHMYFKLSSGLVVKFVHPSHLCHHQIIYDRVVPLLV